jgi:hypothetical protein
MVGDSDLRHRPFLFLGGDQFGVPTVCRNGVKRRIGHCT